LSLSQKKGSSIFLPWNSKLWGFVGATGGVGARSCAAEGRRSSNQAATAVIGFMGSLPVSQRGLDQDRRGPDEVRGLFGRGPGCVRLAVELPLSKNLLR